MGRESGSTFVGPIEPPVGYDQVGFETPDLKKLQDAIAKPYGMVLVCGPTGSGKTTTLYSSMSSLNEPTTNLCTAEDPIEFNLFGINQVQMHEDIGLNFCIHIAFLSPTRSGYHYGWGDS